jgi:hypothetical protein
MSSLAEQFLTLLNQTEERPCQSFAIRTFAGKTFLYAKSTDLETPILSFVNQKGKQMVRGTIWKFNCRFVRQTDEMDVFEIAFLAPEEKSFCCGNQCVNCILKLLFFISFFYLNHWVLLPLWIQI